MVVVAVIIAVCIVAVVIVASVVMNTTNNIITVGSGGGIFSPPTFGVVYDANGGYGAPVDSNRYTMGASVTVAYGAPTRSGYTFNGWFYNLKSRRIISMPRFNLYGDIITALFEGYFSINDCRYVF